MKIVLLQDEIFLPTLGGGTKANRCLLEDFARRGHECLALTRALTSSPDGPSSESQFFEEMSARGTAVRVPQPGVFSYEHNRVAVESLNFSSLETRRAYLVGRIRAAEPDWVFVTDDKRRFMLECALRATPDRVILLLQTIVQLPFGPLSVCPCPEYAALMRRAAGIIVISNFARQYMRRHGSLHAYLLPIPVYGDGPFPNLARFDAGFVTLINPCPLKGLEIFLALADQFPETLFAAVPTWGADEKVLDRLRQYPNVRLLKPADNIEEILTRTRVLLAPSLWPETFGYVVPEAMLRGIPVIASNVGGLPEAKLGVDYLLDVAPAVWRDGAFVSPPQDTSAWTHALGELLSDRQVYERCSRQSRQAALQFVEGVSASAFESLMAELTDKRHGPTTQAGLPADTGPSPEPTKSLHPEFRRHIEQQPYCVILNELRLTIDEDVFPPDMGLCAQNLASMAKRYQPRTALDMGCGSGYLALMLKRHQVPDVWASDNHRAAVACARKNVEANAWVGPIHVVQGDLFERIPATVKFDLIVFNQPFGPALEKPVCGCGPDGGYQITRRFLTEAPAHLTSHAVVLMAFSDREDPKHNPGRVAEELGYSVVTLLSAYYGESNNYIYELRPPRESP